MPKISRLKKLALLKSAVAAQKQSERLIHEQTINTVQTKMLEKELLEMQNYVASLQKQKALLENQPGGCDSENQKED